MARHHPPATVAQAQPRQSDGERQRGAGRRGTLTASIVGSLLLAGLAAPLLPRIVAARGPISDSPYALLTGASTSPNAYAPPRDPAAAAPSGRRSWAGGQPVCVRLCDGAFFPVAVGEAANPKSTCAALCPDAPTALYREPTGSDKIEDAVSSSGAPYTALPVALRHRTTLDNSCTCHRARTQQYPIAQDPTLRKGDYVMTPNGVVVFAGPKNLPHAPGEFTALASASVPQAQRAALKAIERASQLSPEDSARKAPVASRGDQPPLLSVSALQHAQPAAVAATN